MRGTRYQSFRVGNQCRIIPARAGNTALPLATGVLDYGSSPRVRGTLCNDRMDGGHERIIPARAGNTVSNSLVIVFSPDHPRACGEHIVALRFSSAWSGSSPRVRGTRQAAQPPRLCGRIIPARAGNTLHGEHARKESPDHPRACGEHIIRLITGGRVDGSSPRVRGTRFHTGPRTYAWRIIPARAGNTFAVPKCGDPSADHPRACGEHTFERVLFMLPTGSSPRVRGTPLRGQCRHSIGRIIPARAGNTPSDSERWQ